MMAVTIRTGLDLLAERTFTPLRGQRVGLLCHPASVNRRLVHAARILHEAPGVDLCCLFGPQHGLRGETQDNMIEWEGFRDPATGLPVYSLYGDTREPTAAMLDGIDTLVVDLQDVGARYYTFIWTLLLCLRVCARAGKRVTVLDRPNPIGGIAREGTILEPAYHSFVGMAPVPMRHGLTIGELAIWFRARLAIGVDLQVIWMDGWRRSMWFGDTGLPWVMPSPNMPTVDTALVYPGFCLLEGTTLSEGRGTTRPFEICGAPGIDSEQLAGRLRDADLPGVIFRPLRFEPTFHKHAGQLCGGVQVHVTDRLAFKPVLAALTVLAAIRELWPSQLRWRPPPYEYETQKLPIDILAGGPALREQIEDGVPAREIAAGWEAGVAAFTAEIAEFEHYA